MTTNNKIDLNTCVPGQKVKLRDGTLVDYKHKLLCVDYPHLAGNKSYTDDGYYLVSRTADSWDIVEILPLEKPKPKIDLRTCVPGQKLRLRDGRISIYREATGETEYPHLAGSGGSYTDEGYYWLDKRHSNSDVMEILPLEEEPAKTPTEAIHSIIYQIDVSSPDHVSIIPNENGVTISIKKGKTTINWRHSNS